MSLLINGLWIPGEAADFASRHPVTQEAVWSVGELTAHLKDLLETSFPAVWVSGEISNFSRPSSGHCYFTLKDDQAQIRAVMWRTAASRARIDWHDVFNGNRASGKWAISDPL